MSNHTIFLLMDNYLERDIFDDHPPMFTPKIKLTRQQFIIPESLNRRAVQTAAQYVATIDNALDDDTKQATAILDLIVDFVGPVESTILSGRPDTHGFLCDIFKYWQLIYRAYPKSGSFSQSLAQTASRDVIMVCAMDDGGIVVIADLSEAIDMFPTEQAPVLRHVEHIRVSAYHNRVVMRRGDIHRSKVIKYELFLVL